MFNRWAYVVSFPLHNPVSACNELHSPSASRSKVWDGKEGGGETECRNRQKGDYFKNTLISYMEFSKYCIKALNSVLSLGIARAFQQQLLGYGLIRETWRVEGLPWPPCSWLSHCPTHVDSLTEERAFLLKQDWLHSFSSLLSCSCWNRTETRFWNSWDAMCWEKINII